MISLMGGDIWGKRPCFVSYLWSWEGKLEAVWGWFRIVPDKWTAWSRGQQTFPANRQIVTFSALQAIWSLLSLPNSAVVVGQCHRQHIVEVAVFQENLPYINRQWSRFALNLHFADLCFILLKERHQLPICLRWDPTSRHLEKNKQTKIILLGRRDFRVFVCMGMCKAVI